MKRRISCLFIFISIWIVQVNAQVAIQLFPPNPFQVTKESLVRFQLINSTAEVKRVIVDARLNNAAGKSVYAARFQAIELQPGVMDIEYSGLQASYQQFGSISEAARLQQAGIIPYGLYIYCIDVIEVSSGSMLANACQELELGPVSPPVLQSPDDGAIVEQPTPVLTWLPPTPFPQGQDLVYDLRLVEIIKGQSAYEALQRNPALLFQSGLPTNMLLYPPDASPLSVDKRYAWQVMARSGEYTVGETEVWSFSIGQPQPVKDSIPPNDGHYLRVKPMLDGSYSVVIETLRFAYENPYNEGELKYRITDLNGLEVTPSVPLIRKYGDNRYDLNLRKTAGLKSGYFYLLETFSAKNERQVLLFKYYRSESDFKKKTKR